MSQAKPIDPVSARRKLQVATLLGANANLSQKQAAEALGVHPRTVGRALKQIQAEQTVALEGYRKLVEAAMPAAYRSQRLRKIADSDEQLMAALKALERADRIMGIDAPGDQEPRNQPMFSMPQGAMLSITVDTRAREEQAPRVVDVSNNHDAER